MFDTGQLDSITTFPQLVDYLRDELDWPIDRASFDSLTYDYTPDELGLKLDGEKGQIEIKQLRPLAPNQPWGIFFLSFPGEKLPVTVLRRMLGKLAVKKRASSNAAERAAWAKEDLLFISSHGESGHRQLSFAHFHEDREHGDLPTLKVLGWDGENTLRRLSHTHDTLKQKLHWPADESKLDAWRDGWGSAFTEQLGQAISTSKSMARELARLARQIRARANILLEAESEKGPLRQLMKAFKEALIHDLDEDGFADMYAQTVAYGLLSARISRTYGAVVADNVADMVPVTNPFLKELLETFLKAGGRTGGMDFDELGVNTVVEMLRKANMDAVLRDFDDRNPQEDPVIHFYELFLKEYDAKKRIQRGVFYTPRPVVSFIVRSVDELLRTEFGLTDGLADITTWGEMAAKRNPEIKVPDSTSPNSPFVTILDPATGTGTFFVEVIDLIARRMKTKWTNAGKRDEEISRFWNEYVAKHLLPRLYGYELMMAPYAIAHMKIGLKLYETGYRFGTDERARVYLTNSLEPAQDFSSTFEFAIPALAHEAQSVNRVKSESHFTVVVGNPPYSSSICEPKWLMRLLDAWKEGLNETKRDLNREEWKFLRLIQHLVKTSGAGVVGIIINRDFLDGITKRRLREHLGQAFPLRKVIDLNGDVKGNIADENVFEIEQGVAIAILCTHHDSPELLYSSEVGTRERKYADLSAKDTIDRRLLAVEPIAPYFRWVSSAGTASIGMEYAAGYPLNKMFQVYSSGIQTKRDALCIAFDKEELWTRILRLHELNDEAARDEFKLGADGRDWTVAWAKADISNSGPSRNYITPLLYRPFDTRFTYWTGETNGFLGYPRRDVMEHVINSSNVGLIFNRQVVGQSVSHFGVSNTPICHGTFYLGNKGQDYFAPLYVRWDHQGAQPPLRSNITPQFERELSARLDESSGVSPEKILHYAYAIVHSPSYRTRYSELLKLDFPRLPLPASRGVFEDLIPLGKHLVELHLLDFSSVEDLVDPRSVRFAGNGHASVERGYPQWENGRVLINSTRWFEEVPKDVWEFHVGGYQVCEKWLKDRGPKGGKNPRPGRILSSDEILHYRRIVTALAETIKTMAEIDRVIEAHGGWPAAFQRTPEVSVENDVRVTAGTGI